MQLNYTKANIPDNPGSVIPLNNAPNQKLVINPIVDGAPLTLQIELNYSDMAGYWLLTINDGVGNPLLTSIPMITGTYPAANILGQYQYLQIGSAYVINASNSNTPLNYPDNTDLGTDFILIWGDTAP